MTTLNERLDQLSPLQQAALVVKALKSKVETLENARREPIAIIGAACRYPGGADDLHRFWSVLREGVDACREVPADRWDVDAYYDPAPGVPGKCYTRRGGFLGRVDGFDAGFFRIAPREVVGIDPQQRLLLEVAWEALEDAAIPPDRLVGSRTGVYLGISTNDYSNLLSKSVHSSANNAAAGAGNAASIASGRISYTFGFQGPCLAVDTACSSSLVALHLAVRALRAGECSQALVAGVNLMLTPDITVNFSQARLLSPDGKCKTFCESADGYVRGEGCGVVVLKPLSAAQKDGDRILAVIRGTACNQDGRSSGLTAPNGRAQEAVIRQALEDAGLDPQRVSYVEAHGTGTALGDPIEVQALKQVYGPGRTADRPLALGSVKASIGHLEAGAGVASVIKVALALSHREIPPLVHFRRLNPHISLDGLPARIPLEPTEWVNDGPRLAGVSSFGFSGTNVHVLLEEAPPSEPAPAVLPERPLHLLGLSARTEPALRELASRYAAYFSDPTVSLPDAAYTSHTGRAQFRYRAAVIARDAEEARSRLLALAEGAPAEGLLTGEVQPDPQSEPMQWPGEEASSLGRSDWSDLLSRAGRAWVAGVSVDWEAYDAGRGRRKLSLPSYPFQRERFWVETLPEAPAPAHAAPARQALPALHPLLGTPVPQPGSRERRFEARIGRQEPAYLADHCVTDRVVFPAAGYLELALAAAARVLGSPACEVQGIAFPAALLLPEREEVLCHTLLQPHVEGGFELRIFSVSGEDSVEHARGRVAAIAEPGSAPVDRTPIPPAGAQELGVEELYRGLEAAGVRYGPSFRTVRALWRTEGEVVGRVRVEDGAGASDSRHILSPPLLDGCLQLLAAALPGSDGDEVYLPVSLERLRVFRAAGEEVWCRARAVREGGSVLGSLALLGAGGDRIAEIEGVRFRRVSPALWEAQSDSAELEGALYEIRWQPSLLTDSLPAPDFLPRAEALAERLEPRAAQLAEELGLGVYAELAPELDRLSAAYVAGAFRRLGFEFTLGRRVTRHALAAELDIADRHRRLFHRLLEILEEEGVLERQHALWIVREQPESGSPDGRCAELIARYPTCRAELELLRRCGAHLAEVLRDETDALSLLFTAGQDSGAGDLYHDSPYARWINTLLGDAAAEVAASLPSGRALRVLEIGAGTGSATAALLPRLDADRTDYLFTDVSGYFTEQAAGAFAACPFLRCRTLDVERSPEEQGYPAGGYDLVIASNVLHATRDLAESLRHARQLLAPGGLLLLVESTERRRWVDLVFGLTEGWWRFQDTSLRPDHPLLSREAWLELLAGSGFSEAAALNGGQLLLARAESAPAAGGDWLIVPDRGGTAERLTQRLEELGERCHLVVSPDPAAIEALLRENRYRGVTYLAALDAPAQPEPGAALEAQRAVCEGALHLSQALARLEEPPPLYLVTRGSAPAGAFGDAAMQAALAGLARAAALEVPALRCACVDLDPNDPEIEGLAAELIAGSPEAEVAFRAGRRLVPRLAPRAAALLPSTSLRGDAAYLITGGLGDLGLAVAGWMVEQGARHLALLGRSGPSAETARLLREWEKAGARVLIFPADVSDPTALQPVLEQIDRELGPLAGVVHSAGTLDDAPLLEQDWERFERVMGAKVAGAWNLHCLTRDRPLDFFVLFSSAASVLGSAQQANHCAANAALDGLAHARRAQGLPASSINWGVWSGIGEAARRGFDRHAERLGLGTISPDLGIAAFARLLADPAAQTVVLPGADWARFTGAFGERVPSLLRELGGARVPVSGGPVAVASELRGALQGVSPEERPRAVEARLAEMVAAIVGLKAKPDTRLPFTDYGFDSLMAVDLKNRVEAELGVSIPLGRILEGSTIAEVVRFVVEQLSPDVERAAPAPAPARTLTPDRAARFEPFPLTDIQQAYWVGRRAGIELGNIGCQLYSEVDTTGLELPRLERAWQRLVERHDMLRVVIGPDGMQRVLERVPPYRFTVLDLRGVDAETASGRLEAIRESRSHHLFDPEQWPLFDVRATLLDDGRMRLHLGFDLLALDAASIFRLREEWIRLYDDPEQPLPELDLTFRDFVLSEIAHRDTEAHHRARSYWLRRIPALPGPPELPLAVNPASITAPRFARRLGRLDAEEWSALREKARQAGLTPSALLCAAYAEVLAAWSKTGRFCLTLTVFNRPPIHPQIYDLLGDFTSTLLLETDASAAGFVERARSLQQRLSEDLDHGSFTGVQVLRELSRQRGGMAGTVPVVFTSALGFRGPETDRSRWSSLGHLVYSVAQTPQVWLDHQVSEDRDGLLFTWDVVEELFPAGMVAAMFAAYSRLLHDLAAAPALDAPAWQGSLARLLPPDQLARRQEANATDAPVSERLLHELFVTQALAHPEREAVVTPSRRLSYGELYARSHALAVELRARGVRPNQLVAVVMEKGWEQAVAVLAILQAGAAYLPLSASLPPARLHALLAHGEVQVALTQPALPLDFPPGLTLLPVSAETPVPPAGTPLPAPLASVQRPEDLAYVIYTSGSTGEPKGVMIDHRGAVNTVLDLNRRLELGPEDRVLGLSSLSFDLSVYDLFGLFAAGGAVVLPGPEARRDPQAWVELVRRERVSLWNSVPALLGMVTAYGEPLGESLRAVLLSGDWIPLPLPEAVRRLAPRAEVWSLGGATEASIWSIYHRIGAVAPEWRSIPYGKPLANQTFHVLNERGEPCPEGVPGELYIGGIGLARGYWRDPERTAERFVEVGGERLYRTGDLGRYLPDGSLEFLGREDLQVKVQGHRIELGELEAALGSHPGVKAAVAAAVGARQGEKRLVAFVVPHSTGGAPAFGGEPQLAWETAVPVGRRAAREAALFVPESEVSHLHETMSRYYLAAVGSALGRLGLSALAGEWLTVEETRSRLKISPRYRRWLTRAFRALQGAGILSEREGRYSLTSPLPEAPAGTDAIERLDAFGFSRADFDFLQGVVARLPEVLTEELHPAALYTSGQTGETYRTLFQHVNAVVRELFVALAEQPGELRVVEVGGGLGTTARELLPALPPERVRYCFTDLSPYFVQRAREAFGSHEGLDFRTLDLGRTPQEQGFEPHAADVVLAASVFHATRDVAVSLRNARSLLAPGGLLVMVEETRFYPWFDLNMGLQQGFDAFEDTGLRRAHPLLTSEQWQVCLREAGFEACELLSEPGSVPDLLGFHVLVARAPAEAPGVEPVELSDFLRARLPDYMVPSAIHTVPELPLSANGKVDRKALASLEVSSAPEASGYEAPATPEEAHLANLWKSALGVERVGRRDGFFELGGNSLSLVQLHGRIREELGRELSIGELFRDPTIAGIAARLSESGAETAGGADSSLVAIQGGTRPPLFVVPGIVAIPYYLRDLASLLPEDQPVYSWLLPGIAGGEPLRSIEEIAAHCVRSMRDTQPAGPYRIVGHSFGGTVAFEMAQQLRSTGEEVALLALLDSVVTRSGLQAFQREEISLGSAIRALYALYEGQLPPFAEIREMPARDGLARVLETLQQHSLVSQFVATEGLLRVFQANFGALGSYRGRPYAGRITLLRSEGGFPEEFGEHEDEAVLQDPALGWGRLSREPVEVIPVPGTHLTLMSPPYLEHVTRELTRLLERVPE
ncbi:MAG: amino acid adenylation domain-containing protein [Armatimonadota bacterium]